MRLCFVVIMFLLCSAVATQSGDTHVPLAEASGILVINGNLLIVGDDASGRYYRFHEPFPDGKDLIVLHDSLLEVEILTGASLASDLESIEQLSDGRIAVLSEDLSALIGPVNDSTDSCGIIVLYPQFLSEFGNRGLEGVAVDQTVDGLSRIAVLWEGGYPESRALNEQMRKSYPILPFLPQILIHTLEPGRSGYLTRPDSRQLIALKPSELSGKPPDAERFRAPDLVWHVWNDSLGKQTEGFIVLLGSGNAPVNDNATYSHHWLQRFTLDGAPYCEPLDLDPPFYAALRQEGVRAGSDAHIKSIYLAFTASGKVSVNWEGLDWYEPGRSLILVYDTYPAEPPMAFRLALPPRW